METRIRKIPCVERNALFYSWSSCVVEERFSRTLDPVDDLSKNEREKEEKNRRVEDLEDLSFFLRPLQVIYFLIRQSTNTPPLVPF